MLISRTSVTTLWTCTSQHEIHLYQECHWVMLYAHVYLALSGWHGRDMQRHAQLPHTPTCFNSLRLGAADLCKCTGLSWVQVMVCHLMGVKPLSGPMLTYQGHTLEKLKYKCKTYHLWKCICCKMPSICSEPDTLFHWPLVMPYGD